MDIFSNLSHRQSKSLYLTYCPQNLVIIDYFVTTVLLGLRQLFRYRTSYQKDYLHRKFQPKKKEWISLKLSYAENHSDKA
jgi:hypothetical protein